MKNKFVLGLGILLIFCFMACDTGTNSPTSTGNSGGNTGGNGIPSAPTGVSATRQSPSSVYVSWNPVSEATSYNVYYSYYASGPYYFDGPSYSTNFISPDWGASDTGYIKVKAVNSAGESSFSAYASFPAYNSSGGGTDLKSSFMGSWKNSNNVTLYFWSTSFDVVWPTGVQITVWNPTWTPITNSSSTSTSYPNGYRLSGPILSSTVSDVYPVGSTYSDDYYMHTGRQSISLEGGSGVSIFYKQ
jgi:hypothetical protein